MNQCPFSADRIRIELIRRDNFSDIRVLPVPYVFKVEVYTCTF